MRNLKDETLQLMKYLNLTIDDIDWVGGSGFTIPVDLFFKLADVEYEEVSNIQEVADDLRIVFKDGTVFTRHYLAHVDGWLATKHTHPDVERTDITALTCRQIEQDKKEELYRYSYYSWLDKMND